jgi:hypothetical protein
LNVYVPLRPIELERLQELALRERRTVKQQAAYLIARGLDSVPDADHVQEGSGDASTPRN